MSKGFGFLAVITIVVGFASGVGLGMWQAGSAASANQPPASGAGGVAATQNLGAAVASERAGNDARDTPLTGIVESAADGSMAVRTSNGTVKVALGANTTIQKSETLTVTQIAPGESVSAVGSKGADGVMTARSIQVGIAGSAEEAGRGASAGPVNSPANAQAQGGQGSVSQAAGTVESVGADRLVVKTSAGNVTVAVSAQTTLRKTVGVRPSELAQGASVVVIGPRSSDGVVAAVSVQIMPVAPEGSRRAPSR